LTLFETYANFSKLNWCPALLLPTFGKPIRSLKAELEPTRNSALERVCPDNTAGNAAEWGQTSVESGMKIYVGNLSFDTSEDDLRQAFEAFGAVTDINIVMDRETGRPRGFAFVEMSGQSEATAAITGMNGKELNGRALNVNEARPRPEGGGGGGRGGGGGGGGHRGGGSSSGGGGPRRRSW
jgi:RNA recognition motif-containing protein